MRIDIKYRMLPFLFFFTTFIQGQDVKQEKLFIEYLTSRELSTKIQQGVTTVLIYSGGTEATGPHVALGKHNFRVSVYAQRIADSLKNTLIAPILPFAPNSSALQKMAGTFTLDSLTFSKVNEQLAISMITSGFKHIIFMSDHFNSQKPLAQLAKELDSTYSSRGIDIYYAADGYTKARKEIEDYIEQQNIVPGGHGGLWFVDSEKRRKENRKSQTGVNPFFSAQQPIPLAQPTPFPFFPRGPANPGPAQLFPALGPACFFSFLGPPPPQPAQRAPPPTDTADPLSVLLSARRSPPPSLTA